MKMLTRLAFPALLVASAFASQAGACTLKPGYVGGDMVKAPGLTPLCGAAREKVIAGLKAAYRQQGVTMPSYRWFEVYTSTPDNTSLPVTSTRMIFSKYTPDEKRRGLESKFGYMARNYVHKTTGKGMTFIFYVEPRKSSWKTRYNVFIGW